MLLKKAQGEDSDYLLNQSRMIRSLKGLPRVPKPGELEDGSYYQGDEVAHAGYMVSVADRLRE